MYDALRYMHGCKAAPYVKVAYNAELLERWVLKKLRTLGLPWYPWGDHPESEKYLPRRNLTNGVTYIQY